MDGLKEIQTILVIFPSCSVDDRLSVLSMTNASGISTGALSIYIAW